MVLYVVYRAPRESKDRSIIPKRLRALGCRPLHKSFWMIDENKVNKVLKVLEKNQPILLRRAREIRKPRFIEGRGISDLGSLIIVTYAHPKEAKREKVRNVLRGAPCIRLCRSVYAFSQRHALYDKNNRLVNAQGFFEFVKETYENVRLIPRVVIADEAPVERLVQETKERVENEISDITGYWDNLYWKVFRGEDPQLVGKEFARIRRRFLKAKRVATFFERWLRLDFSRSLMRNYRTRRRIKPLLRGAR